MQDDGKALPARPESGDYRADEHSEQTADEEGIFIETATATRIVNDQSYILEYPSRSIPLSQVPRRRESLLPSTVDYRRASPGDSSTERSYNKSPMREREQEDVDLARPLEESYVPPPLSPRRPSSPVGVERQVTGFDLYRSVSPAKGHRRAPSNESMSWLDTIDESSGSGASSIHSRTSSLGVRRKHLRAASGATEAEFDAALDAAVEAAYDEGYEPVDGPDTLRYDYDDDDDEVVANVRRKVELAKERVRQSEREAAIQDARDKERKRILSHQSQIKPDMEEDYDENESEEEERMLEEMTRGYVMEDFEFGLQSKSALPRESDSSGFSGRTWNSSIGSSLATTGTVLSTVAETSTIPQIPPLKSRTPPPMHPPPSQALPQPPSSSALPPLPPQGVRSRRLSGQNAKQLKIETANNASTNLHPPLNQPPSIPPPRLPSELGSTQKVSSGVLQRQPLQVVPARPSQHTISRQTSSSIATPSPVEIVSPPTPNLAPAYSFDGELNVQPRSGSPARTQSRTGLRKNFSSSSLKNLKARNLSVSGPEDTSDMSPNTPLSSQFATNHGIGKIPAVPSLPTPVAATFKDRLNGTTSGGLYLFDIDLHSPAAQGASSSLNGGPPSPLEPCPTEFLLRPFWLMRALYQTLTHPRGGYLSTKLFVPHDVWSVRGVKLKGVEDKIANCDFLTAALLKLAQVDTFDADAVLEEMQSLEGVLEQIQAALTKKLGNEVGVQGSGGFFRDALNENTDPTSASSKPGPTSNKSSFSWRRLKPKNSAVGLTSSYSTKIPIDGFKENVSLATLPMTTSSLAKFRFSKRDVNSIQFSGPNASYMSSLARLFDAAQTLGEECESCYVAGITNVHADQIARQVEDPGLRHADKTQVGLELCTRHAAEFFGFYVCRFVLNDVAMLLDKFIKRGSEWVLA